MNDAFGHPQSVVVLGGTSDIARELVALLVEDRGRSWSSPDATDRAQAGGEGLRTAWRGWGR